jgi:hypothetical protein
MSIGGTNTALKDHTTLSGAPTAIFWIILISLLPFAALFGGMRWLLIALAIIISVLVFNRPQEAPSAGVLFLFGASIVLPYASRFDFTLVSNEMYYWAAGLLMITAAAVLRIGLRRVFAIPISAKVFLGLALVSALYAEINGAPTSYVIRQFYGVLLLILYFGIAQQAGDEELIVRRTATFGVLCAVLFFVYYAAVFAEYGFHKEIGFNGTQASFLAIILFLTALERRNALWAAGGLALFGVPVLIFMRKDVLTFLMALPMAFAMKLKSKLMRLVCFVFIGMIALTALFPPVTQIVSENMKSLAVLDDIMPSGIQDSTSLYERSLQLGVALATIRSHPLLGAGLGSIFQWESPSLGFLEVGYIDNGWAYILQKMGLLGTVAFAWFLVTVLRNVSVKFVALSACLLAATIVTMFSEPVFLHFTTAPFLGTFAGLLCRGTNAAATWTSTGPRDPSTSYGTFDNSSIEVD